MTELNSGRTFAGEGRVGEPSLAPLKKKKQKTKTTQIRKKKKYLESLWGNGQTLV
jgi:hypothetical protein